jgi:hypothetical protein
LVTSDGGGDQIKCRKVIKAEVMDRPNDIFVDLDCKQHANELNTKWGLIRLDSWLTTNAVGWHYFAATAKVMHVWRECARKAFLAACVLFDDEVGIAGYKKMPPRPISGRWGRIHEVERCLLSVAQSLPRVIKAVLRGDAFDVAAVAARGEPGVAAILDIVADVADAADVAPPPRADPPAPPARALALDDPRAQSQEEYRIKMGQWRAAVWSIVQDKTFWLVTTIASMSRAPLVHHHAFVMSKLSRADIERAGNHQAQLTCGKADAIFLEFNALLTHGSVGWAPMVVEKSRSTTISTSEFLCLGVELITNHAAGYARRIVRPTKLFLGPPPPSDCLPSFVSSHTVQRTCRDGDGLSDCVCGAIIAHSDTR